MQENSAHLPAVQEEKKTKITAREFVNNLFQPLKGKDLNQAVEDFSAEMTLVIEGMSEDLEHLTRQTDGLSAQQTIAEETLADVQKELKALQKRLDKTEKAIADKKVSKVAGFTGMLRQATWLAAVIGASWVIITLIKALL
ncbi:MAG: hypothetical protein IKM05_09405 [Clostridia bacterium]|nr:hypothetical protein [Clostridia bacterium]